MNNKILEIISFTDDIIKKENLFSLNEKSLRNLSTKDQMMRLLRYEVEKYTYIDKVYPLIKKNFNISSHEFRVEDENNSFYVDNFKILLAGSENLFQPKLHFLSTGFYFGNLMVSKKGKIYVSFYSKNLPPVIFESKLTFPKKEGKRDFEFLNRIKSIYGQINFIDNNELIFNLDLNLCTEGLSKKQLENILISNAEIKNLKNPEFTTLKISMNETNKFDWNFMIFSLNKLISNSLNEDQYWIMKRADLVFYVLRNIKNIEKNIYTLTENQKQEILKCFNSNKVGANLLSATIDLKNNKNYNSFYVDSKNFYKDFGAEQINKLFDYLYLQLSLNHQKSVTHRKIKI